MTIEDFLKENKTYNIFAKGSTKKAQEQLYENEKLLYALNANVDIVNTKEENFSNRNKMTAGALNLKNKLNGVVVITTERIFFCNSVLGQTNMKEIRISDITSIDGSTSILKMGELRIKGLTEMFVISIANEKIMDEIKQYINIARKNEKVDNSCISTADELKKYKELLDAGAISQVEFEKMKNKLIQ